jgi:FkbM family methyltransferase
MIKGWLKKVYSVIPGKKLFFSFWKLFGTPRENIFRHLNFHGTFKVNADQNHAFRMWSNGYQLENEIFWGGLYYRYEKVSINLWKELCKHSKVIMDVGANSGVYTLVAKAMNKDADVHAFEPIERVFNTLEKNIQINSFHVSTVKKALSNGDGTAIIYDVNTPNQYAASLSRNVFGSDVHEEVIETIRLDSYIRQNQITGIDLIKIDVERHEPEVLTGMGSYLHTMKPAMLIEIVEEENAQRILSIIGDIGYLFFDINENSGCTLKPSLGKSSYNNWLICSPETADLLHLKY